MFVWVSLVFLLFGSMVDGLQAECPPGWLTWQDSCYTFLPEKMNWFDASRVCDRPGSAVAMPESRDEQDFLWQERNNFMSEIGINPEDDDGLWIGCNVFNDDKQLTCYGVDVELEFDNWQNGQPSEYIEHCIRMRQRAGGKWADFRCTDEKFAACEMRISPQPVHCLTADADGRFAPQCLLNHEIKNLTTNGVIGCGQACWAEPGCHSFNLLQQGKICQINNASRHEADVLDFVIMEDCSFFDL